MAKVVAMAQEYLNGDAHLGVTFRVTMVDAALRAMFADRDEEVYVEIPHYVSPRGYYAYAVNQIVDSFEDRWGDGYFILPSDISIIGWRELLPLSEQSYEISEEFLGSSTLNGEIGQFGWEYTVDGEMGSVTASKVSVPGHPGVFRLSFTSGSELALSTLSFPSAFADPGVQDLVMIARTGRNDPDEGMNDVIFDMGIGAENYQISCFLSGSDLTAEPEVVISSASDFRTVPTGIEVHDMDWLEYRMSLVNANTFRIRVSNLTTRVVDDMRLEVVFFGEPDMVYPYFFGMTGSTMVLDADLCRIRVNGLTRGWY